MFVPQSKFSATTVTLALATLAIASLCARPSFAAPDVAEAVSEASDEAPTTRPSNPTAGWVATLSAFSTALQNGSAADVAPVFAQVVSDDASVREFNRVQRSSLATLREKSLTHTLIASRAYSVTPSTLAGDLAADVRDADLPALAKRRLTPADEPDLKRANSVASKWIDTTLMTSGAEPIGVLVFWEKDATADDSDAAADANRVRDVAEANNPPKESADVEAASHAARRVPLFVLVKGELVAGKYVIRQICYGNPIMLGGGG